MIDYSKLKYQILRELRGPLTQTQLSERLGFSYNQFGKWETEKKRLKWTDFYYLCEAARRPIDQILRDVFLFQNDDLSDPKIIVQGLQIFNSRLSKQDIATRLNCHVSVIHRWIAGTVAPDIEFIFMLMNLRVNLLPTFVARLVKIESVPELTNLYLDEQRAKRNFSNPLLLSVWLAVRLKKYQDHKGHKLNLLTEITGLSENDVQNSLTQLEAMGHISWSGGKYQTRGDLPFKNMHGEKAFIGQMRSYWAQRSLSRFHDSSGLARNDQQRPNLQSFFTTAVSKTATKKISECLHRAFEEMIQIVNEDNEPEEEIRVILMDVFSPDDAPAAARKALEHGPQS